MKIKHTDRFRPTTLDAIASYNSARYFDHLESGLHYQTGPRRGAQLALLQAVIR
jgi:hypothetical protein